MAVSADSCPTPALPRPQVSELTICRGICASTTRCSFMVMVTRRGSYILSCQRHLPLSSDCLWTSMLSDCLWTSMLSDCLWTSMSSHFRPLLTHVSSHPIPPNPRVLPHMSLLMMEVHASTWTCHHSFPLSLCAKQDLSCYGFRLWVHLSHRFCQQDLVPPSTGDSSLRDTQPTGKLTQLPPQSVM